MLCDVVIKGLTVLSAFLGDSVRPLDHMSVPIIARNIPISKPRWCHLLMRCEGSSYCPYLLYTTIWVSMPTVLFKNDIVTLFLTTAGWSRIVSIGGRMFELLDNSQHIPHIYGMLVYPLDTSNYFLK
jgi:hypothetical protein